MGLAFGAFADMRNPPAAVFDQAPAGLNSQNTSVRIANRGDQNLFISYWNGASAWENVSLPAGQTTFISCGPCGPTISFAYNDGHATQTLTASVGGSYFMAWSSSASRWELSPGP